MDCCQGSVSQFSHSILSKSLRPHGLQHARLPCPSLTPGACSNSSPLSWWCHPTISSSVVPFSSCLQSFPASESFPRSQFFTSSGQSIGVSALPSVLPMNIQGIQVAKGSLGGFWSEERENMNYNLNIQLGLECGRVSQVALVVKNLPANTGDERNVGLIPGLGRSPGEGMVTHSNLLARRIPWTEEPGRLLFMWLQRVGHD